MIDIFENQDSMYYWEDIVCKLDMITSQHYITITM